MNKQKKEEKRVHVVFDAIHQTMLFDDEGLKDNIKLIIDDPLFQRLKGIKQLGLSDMVFPTATHSRFSHSLGTAYLCWRIIKNLKLDHEDKEKSLLTVYAALLHDIGHGPFSHAFEIFLESTLEFEISHDKDWFREFLNIDKWGFNKDDRKYLRPIFRKVKQLKEVKRSEHDIFNDLLSSQLDTDRLDYLLRDSHFCGVEYGTYDLEWLINTMLIHPTSGKKQKLAVSYKGIGAVENFLLNRRLMTQNIYYHKTVKGFEHLFIRMLNLITGNNLKRFQAKISPPLFDLLIIVNKFKKKKSKDKERFMREAFESYSKLCDYDFWFTLRSLSGVNRISKELKHLLSCFYKRQSPMMIPVGVDPDTAMSIINKLKKDATKSQIDLVVLVPFKFYNIISEEIIIIDEGGHPRPANEVSEIFRRLGGSVETRYYLLVDKEYCKRHSKRVGKILEELKCPKAIFEKCSLEVKITPVGKRR